MNQNQVSLANAKLMFDYLVESIEEMFGEGIAVKIEATITESGNGNFNPIPSEKMERLFEKMGGLGLEMESDGITSFSSVTRSSVKEGFNLRIHHKATKTEKKLELEKRLEAIKRQLKTFEKEPGYALDDLPY